MAHYHRKRKGERGSVPGDCRAPASRSRERRRTQLGLEQLEPRRVLAPMISEFLASNTDTVTGLQDFQGTLQDWIEIYNPDTQPVDLTGWKLQDSGSTWRSLPDARPRRVPCRLRVGQRPDPPELHTNFKLSRDPGEYLGLLDNLGRVVHEYRPSFPRQERRFSYGIGQNIAETKLVSAGADTRYFVPTNASLARLGCSGVSMTCVGSWAHGPGVRQSDARLCRLELQGQCCRFRFDRRAEGHHHPSYQTAVYTETAGLVNYQDTGGGGHFTPDNPSPECQRDGPR